MISIIVPTYNEEKYIHNLLNSIKDQSFKKYEVIVVDASDNNKTINILKKFSKFFKIKIFKSKNNVSYQRNLGVKKASYDNIVFIDADSALEKDVLFKISQVFGKGIESGASHTYPLSNESLYKLYYAIFRIFTTVFYRLDGVNGCFIFSKKKVHEEINGFNEKVILAEDYEYTKRLLKASNFKLITNIKVKTSIRRFNHDGKVILPLKLMCAGLYRVFVGDIKNDLFKYRFGIFNK